MRRPLEVLYAGGTERRSVLVDGGGRSSGLRPGRDVDGRDESVRCGATAADEIRVALRLNDGPNLLVKCRSSFGLEGGHRT
jgi:hypothetical protein